MDLRNHSWFRDKKYSLIRQDITAVSIILVIWVMLGCVAIRGVDYHHQGLVFSEALRVADGQVLYRDIFSQYGPVPAYFQGLFIALFGERITSLIILSLLLHFASSAIMYTLWRRIYSTHVAVSGISIWLGTSYFLRMDYPFFPWWGDFVLFFSCIATLIIYRMENKKCLAKGRSFLPLLLGLSLLGIFLTRYHLGLALVFLLGIYYWKQKKSEHFFWQALFYAFSFILILVFIAIGTEVFHQVIYQTVIWPYQWVNGARPGSPPVDRFVYAILLLGLKPMMVLVVGFFIIADLKSQKLHLRTLFSVLLLYALHRFQGMVNTNYWPPPGGPLMSGQFNSEGVLWALLVLFIVLALKRLPTNLDLQIMRRQWPANELIGVVVLLGIYPVPDHAHLWASVLPIIGPTIANIGKLIDNKKLFRRAANIMCFWIVLFGGSNALHKIQSNVFVHSNNRFTTGMYESVQSSMVRTPIMKALSLLQEGDPEQKFLNYCADPLYDSFGAQSKGPDPYNFLWGPGQNGVFLPANSLGKSRRKWINKEKPIIITCGPDKTLDDLIVTLNYDKYLDSQTEGADYLGGQLSIRVFKPTTLNKN